MTQKERADQIFISTFAVSKWENGRGMSDISYLQPIASILVNSQDANVIEMPKITVETWYRLPVPQKLSKHIKDFVTKIMM